MRFLARTPKRRSTGRLLIGCNAFRLSVEWARLEPRPGHHDDAALEHYAEILSQCAARGLEPIVTLHHFTHPWWQGEEFWLRPGSPDVFARHVARIVPALTPHCRRWVTINEPNIVMLMGWIEGASPPGRRMAVADAYCALDNLLTAHVLAADVVSELQPEAEVTMNTSSSSIYEHDRMLLDLLQLRDAGVDPADVDRYVDERRTLHDAVFPAQHAGEQLVRRFFAAVSPYGTVREPGRGAAWARLRGHTRRNTPRRVVSAVHAATRALAASTLSVSTGTTQWRATPCASPDAAPQPAVATGRSGRALMGRRAGPGPVGSLVRHRGRPASGPPAVGRRERDGHAGARRPRRAARRRHGPPPLRA